MPKTRSHRKAKLIVRYMPVKENGDRSLESYWSLPPDEVARRLACTTEGLSSPEAEDRLKTWGHNQIHERERLSRLRVLWSQIRNPLQLLLIFAAIASAVTGEWTDAAIVFVIVIASSGIGYTREYSAGLAAAALERRIRVRTSAVRNGASVPIPFDEVVPGDILLFAAGALIPADGVIVEAIDCYVSEAALTGESFPVHKKPGVVKADTRLAERFNCLFAGSNIRSGTAKCLIVKTGHATQFGVIAHRLSLKPPETEFDRGLRRFGYLLTLSMLSITFAVFAIHVLRGRPAVETLLFAIALAVGLSPELLPAILSVSLSRGAQAMAARGVLVRRLNAIENLGSMDVLCTDKTGTLTEGIVKLDGAYDADGNRSDDVLHLAALNAALETGLANPLDDAILNTHQPDTTGVRKLSEIPFDFTRKRVSVVLQTETGAQLITKGAFDHIAEISTVDPQVRAGLERRYREWSQQGTRVIALATRDIERRASYGREDERDLVFRGFLTFLDRPKEGAAAALADLLKLGVRVKVITGDSRFVALHIAKLVGMASQRMVTGEELDKLQAEALWHVAEEADLFVEVDPNQKEMIISSLRRMGHVVGFLGDGVNDAPAMHSADTSLSVEEAVDVARQAADFVLLEKDLHVIRDGIEEGRKTFANTLKYVLTTTSANLGNMVSMAASSLFLPFLPLLAGQILLNNFLSDIPAIGMANDSVDRELVDHPRRWDIRFIARFMVEFGVLSSVFDLVTFAMLLYLFHASVELFRSGWFVESLLTELVIALVVRTRRPFFRSRPGSVLLWSTVVLIILTLAIPHLPFAKVFGFVPLPTTMIVFVLLIVALYVLAAEILKRWFYRRRLPI
jgi:Mg2+-importing ATPase